MVPRAADPVLDVTRARRELGWSPEWSAGDALLDLLGGFADAAHGPTPALAQDAPPLSPRAPA